MNKSPCFPFYPSDFFGDVKVRIMTGEEQAFYMLLLANMWEFDTQFSIPNDPKIIANLLKISEEKWEAISGKILACFEQKNGCLVSKRLKKEKEKQDNYRKQQSIKGFKSANRRSTTVQLRFNHGSTVVPTGGVTGVQPEVNSSISNSISKKNNTGGKLPTIEQVREYCLERKNNIDPQRWFDHYTSNGWMVGKNKMRDWRAAVRTWETSPFRGNGDGVAIVSPKKNRTKSPFVMCPKCGEEYLETDVVDVDGSFYCPKCPEARAAFSSGSEKLSKLMDSIGARASP